MGEQGESFFYFEYLKHLGKAIHRDFSQIFEQEIEKEP